MDISVTQFRAQCLELIRQVEAGGEEIRIRRHGRVVARLSPPLHGSGQLHVAPEDSVLSNSDFSALQ